ncbi:CDP-alcohol phosphatidyltransferase family protein [Haliangium sp.]|uniref:CDP-alcohol phosphatidyltransferase family protein n=1 Tax=Haliangium sp. TaxID=2663208 RepID=UPI003D101694
MTEQAGKRPLITANMVTVVRFVPMPILCWLIYDEQIWLALILGTIIGCTDFVDGYLARKHGPTVLGGLLDPMADKVFIALAYLPFADPALGWVPAWAVALMFMREFLVTALRSAYEQRGMSLKTSYFGKVKTWTQMQGLGMILLFMLLADQRDVLYGLIIALIAAPLVAVLVLYLVRRRFWPGALLMSLLTLPLLYFHFLDDIRLTMGFVMLVIVVLTWLSGIDYMLVGLRELRGRGDFGMSDLVRILGALALPAAIFAALTETAVPVWALGTVLAVELAVGGLDNLLSHHKMGAGALVWALRTWGASALLLVCVALALNEGAAAAAEANPLPLWLGVAAAVVSVLGVVREFWRGRDYYIDRRLRDKAMAANAA